MKYTKIALGVAALAAMTAAQAADVSVYGRVDAGLMVTDVDGGDTTTELKSGGRSTNRIGFNILEDLGNGYKVKGYFENGFKVDDGTMGTANTLFDRRSILAVQGPWGELGGGRAGTVQSTMAPYSMGAIKWDVFGTAYGNASIGSTFANSSRVNNGIHYISPSFNNFKVGMSYSFGDKADDVEWQDKSHTFAAALNYQTDNVFLALTFANVDNQHGSKLTESVSAGETAGKEEYTAKDGRAYQVGGWLRVNPDLRLFAGAGYQTNWSTGGKMGNVTWSRKVAGSKELAMQSATGGWDGYSAVLGVEYNMGAHKFLADVQHFTGELAKNSDVDFKRTVYAAAYEYYFTKKVIGYTALTFSDASGSATRVIDSDVGKDTMQYYAGLCWLW